MTMARTTELSAYLWMASTVSRASLISPSSGTMATRSPNPTSPDSPWNASATKPRKIIPANTTRQPLRAPNRKIGARERGTGLAGGASARAPVGARPAFGGCVTASQTKMAQSALGRRLRRLRHLRGPLRLGDLHTAVLQTLLVRERRDVACRQADLSLCRIDLDDAGPDGFANMEGLVQLQLHVALDLRYVGQPFDAVRQAHKQTEVRDLRDRTNDFIPDLVDLCEVIPLVGKELTNGQRQTLILAIDVDDSGLHRVAALQHLVRVLEAAVPPHVRDVDQTVDPFLHLDEGAEVGQVAHLARDHGAHRVTLGDRVPWVLLQR